MRKTVSLAILFVCFCWPLTIGAAAVPEKASDWVDVREYIPSAEVEMIYATEDNFIGKALYPNDTCLLRRGTAKKLKKAQELFEKDGYSLKIWDAYRPLSVQKIMWEYLPNSNFVANPKNGSKHNRGASVDITLTKDGVEVEMPTEFDNFTSAAGRNSKTMTKKQRENMEYLTKIMEKCGFKTISTEWWHYDDTQWKDYPVSDQALKPLIKTK